MYVVDHNTLSDSFRIRIIWFQPKQDSDRISFFKNRIGSDSKNALSDHLWCQGQQEHVVYTFQTFCGLDTPQLATKASYRNTDQGFKCLQWILS